MRAELEARCPGAIFAGQRVGIDLAAHYASGDLLLFPSLTETFGNVTPEAMASGLPIVAFDYAAAAQLIRSGDNGILVPYGDVAAYVKASVGLAADRQHRKSIGERARTTANELGWDGIVERFEAVLSTVIRPVGDVQAMAFTPPARRPAV
jgi:glycosyltransferase involved in cell wall biosynthesis